MRNYLRFFTLLMAVTLVGCGASIPTIKPYKMDIQQGNVVTSEMLLKLRPGMTKSQVRFIMGTPLLLDSFHSNRWDYFYRLSKQGKIVNQRRVILDFENDLLKRVRGDVVAKGATVEDVTKQLEAEAGNKEKSDQAEGEENEAAEPIIQPIEAPNVEPVVAVPEVSESTLVPTSDEANVSEGVEDSAPASVLVVPVPVVPLEPTDIAPKVEMQEEVPAAIQMPNKEIMQEAAPVVEAAPVDIPSKSESIEELKKELPISTHSDNKRVFRMDKQLDTRRISLDQNAESKAPVPESVVQEVKESQNEASLEEEDPSFFERMLEKIGF